MMKIMKIKRGGLNENSGKGVMVSKQGEVKSGINVFQNGGG